MKKIALLLAALLVLGLLAGCNKEEKQSTPDYVVPGYDVNLYMGEGWETVPDSTYDLELSKDGVTMKMITFVSTDFVEKPSVEEIYDICTDDLLETLTDVKVVEEQTIYQAGSNTVVSAMYSGKSEEGTARYYCFAVQFTDEAESMSWVCYSASADTMKKEKATLKAAVEAMTANGELVTQEELEAQIDAIVNGAVYDDSEDSEEYVPQEEEDISYPEEQSEE